MKLNCKRIDFTYTPGEEIFNFPEESGLPFIFDVEEELTADPAAMDVVGEMLDEAEKLAEKAKAAIKAALADEDSRYHSAVSYTHLDVYKRQPLLRMTPSGRKMRSPRPAATASVSSVQLLGATITSYSSRG